MAKSAGKGGKSRTIKDFQNGKAKDDHELPVDGHGANEVFEPEGATLDEFLALAITNETKKEDIKERMRLRNEPDKQKIAELTKEVATAKSSLVREGYDATALDTWKRQKLLHHKADTLTKELDKGQLQRHREITRAHYDFSGTPLGNHASREPAEAEADA